MHLKDIFIRNLKRYRKTRGLSQASLAKLCDSSTGYIGQIEIGSKFPSWQMMEKIAAALEIQAHLLFLDEYSASAQTGSGGEAASPPYAMPEEVKDDLARQIGAAVRRIVKKY